ncbi:unnamed protein product, partial [Mesorhabditis spiculigera]
MTLETAINTPRVWAQLYGDARFEIDLPFKLIDAIKARGHVDLQPIRTLAAVHGISRVTENSGIQLSAICDQRAENCYSDGL